MTDDVLTETVCESCSHNGNKRSEYCPSCGAEDSWIEQPQYDFEDVEMGLQGSVTECGFPDIEEVRIEDL